MIEKLSIIIPVFNEENTIYQLLETVYKLSLIEKIKKEIIVINDCSKDHSENEIKRFMDDHKPTNFNFINNPKNLGKEVQLKLLWLN